MNAPLFEFAHGRVKGQIDRMKECERLGICPFCWENLAKWHDAPILEKGDFWVITANDHPYAGAKYHYLAIYKEHVDSINWTDPAAYRELFLFFDFFCKKDGMKGASILMRFGDMSYTGATLSHLHAHLISGASREELPDPKYPDDFIMSAIGYKLPK